MPRSMARNWSRKFATPTNKVAAGPCRGPAVVLPVMKKSLIRLEAGIVRLEGALLFLILVALLVTLTMQVVTRFLLELPFAWTEEFGRVLQMWLVFIGAAVGTRRFEHFVVELFMDKVNFPGKHAVARLIDITVVGFFCVLTWIAAQTTLSGAGQILPTLNLSIAWAYAAIPVGSLLMAFHFAMAWVRPPESAETMTELAE